MYPRIAESLQAHFARRGDMTVGDCGYTLALVVCICSIIPFVHLAAFVALIIFFVKVFSLTGRIGREGAPAAAPA